MDTGKLWNDASYVKISSYRSRVIKCLNDPSVVMIPKDIARESDILPNHVSNVLRELKNKGIIECLNEDARKGRLYRLTDYGVKVVTVLGEIF